MMVDILNRLNDSGELQLLYKSGLISHRALMFREYYFEVDIQQRVHKKELVKAVESTADKFKCSTDTVYRAIRTMKL